MENITIGINQRIPIHILELALCAALQDDASPEYFSELAATEYKGENRIKKAVSVINKLTIRNPIFGYLHEHTDAVLAAMKNKHDRPLLFAMGAIVYTFILYLTDNVLIYYEYWFPVNIMLLDLVNRRPCDHKEELRLPTSPLCNC